MADTRSIQQDGIYKWSVATQIKEHTDSIIAVLVLANGAKPPITVGTDHELSTLSAMFPKSLSPNVSFMFTNVLNPLHWNISLKTIPHDLRGAPQFLLNNPVALQKEYLRLKDDPNMKKRRADLRNAVEASEQNALQMLVEFFDWLDSLEPRGATKAVTRSQKHEGTSTVLLSPIAIYAAVSCSPCTQKEIFSLSLGIADETFFVYKFIQPPIVTEEKEAKITRTDKGAPKKCQGGVDYHGYCH